MCGDDVVNAIPKYPPEASGGYNYVECLNYFLQVLTCLITSIHSKFHIWWLCVNYVMKLVYNIYLHVHQPIHTWHTYILCLELLGTDMHASLLNVSAMFLWKPHLSSHLLKRRHLLRLQTIKHRRVTCVVFGPLSTVYGCLSL